MDLAGGEEFYEVEVGFIGFGEEDDAGGIFIEAVDDAWAV